jgi:hypothetical protein
VDLVDLLAVKEDPFGQGRLPGIDMRTDTDVPHARNIDLHLKTTLGNYLRSDGLPLGKDGRWLGQFFGQELKSGIEQDVPKPGRLAGADRRG